MTIRLVLLGRQGSGKGTQGARLATHYNIVHVSTGEMLRNAIKHNTPVGKVVKDVIDNGGLVADDLIGSLVQGRLGESDARTRGDLLDGFPRTRPHAKLLDDIARARPVTPVAARMAATRRANTSAGVPTPSTTASTPSWRDWAMSGAVCSS
ncbi:MAG: adenylate kinase family protein [Actinomycetota bacterium]